MKYKSTSYFVARGNVKYRFFIYNNNIKIQNYNYLDFLTIFTIVVFSLLLMFSCSLEASFNVEPSNVNF